MKTKLNKLLCLTICAIILSVGISISASAEVTLLGDSYADGQVDTKDVNYLRKTLAGYNMSSVENYNADNCDCDGDESITMLDLLSLRKYLAGGQEMTTSDEWSRRY